ncbi:MAG: hypothetical protein D6809_00725 [Gammaproteobacteria bacterium]|nr:MAG: hypothetical protein D6809_00725 [Gammaproteobacteria bacterium]
MADFRIHGLGHPCAAWLVSSGVPLAEVGDLPGHSSIHHSQTTERYPHLAPEQVRAAVEVLTRGEEVTIWSQQTGIRKSRGGRNCLKILVGGAGIEPATPAV